MLITDYSSVMFDYVNTGRPMLFFTWDLDDYRDRVRGLYFDLTEDPPGPICRTSSEVVSALDAPADADAVRRRLRALPAAFLRLGGRQRRGPSDRCSAALSPGGPAWISRDGSAGHRDLGHRVAVAHSAGDLGSVALRPGRTQLRHPSVDSVRIDPLGIIVPQIPVGAVFGPTLPTFYAFAFLATTLVVAVVYGLARWVGPPLIAALTVVVLVAQPLTLLNLSRGYPDLMAVALNGLTLILVLLARARPGVVAGERRSGGRMGLRSAGDDGVHLAAVRVDHLADEPTLVRLPRGRARVTAVGAGRRTAVVVDAGRPMGEVVCPDRLDLNDSTSVLDGAYLGHQRWWYISRLPIAMAQEPWAGRCC